MFAARTEACARSFVGWSHIPPPSSRAGGQAVPALRAAEQPCELSLFFQHINHRNRSADPKPHHRRPALRAAAEQTFIASPPPPLRTTCALQTIPSFHPAHARFFLSQIMTDQSAIPIYHTAKEQIGIQLPAGVIEKDRPSPVRAVSSPTYQSPLRHQRPPRVRPREVKVRGQFLQKSERD